MCDETNNLIITLVQGCPHLYNKKDSSYKDARKRENSWMSIAEITGMSVLDCQTRWKSLRDRYCREKKKLDAPSGSGAVVISENAKELIKSLNFLDTIVHHRKTAGNYSESSGSAVTNVGDDESLFQPIGFIDSPQPSTSGIKPHLSSRQMVVPINNQRASQDQSLRTTSRAAPLATPQRSTCVAPPLVSPAADLSPSLTDSADTTGSPLYRFRTISSSDRDSLSTPSPFDPSFEEELLPNETLNQDPCVRAKSTEPRTQRLKRVRTEDVNAALMGALSSLSSMRKRKQLAPPQADQLFAESLVAELQRFPPRKRALIKGEIMQLISTHDETEL